MVRRYLPEYLKLNDWCQGSVLDLEYDWLADCFFQSSNEQNSISKYVLQIKLGMFYHQKKLIFNEMNDVSGWGIAGKKLYISFRFRFYLSYQYRWSGRCLEYHDHICIKSKDIIQVICLVWCLILWCDHSPTSLICSMFWW